MSLSYTHPTCPPKRLSRRRCSLRPKNKILLDSLLQITDKLNPTNRMDVFCLDWSRTSMSLSYTPPTWPPTRLPVVALTATSSVTQLHNRLQIQLHLETQKTRWICFALMAKIQLHTLTLCCCHYSSSTITSTLFSDVWVRNQLLKSTTLKISLERILMVHLRWLHQRTMMF